MRTATPPSVLCFVLAAAGAGSLSAVCTPSPTVLCLQGRFAVDVAWVDPLGGTRAGRGTSFPAPVSANETGYFWFTDDRYVEVFVKILDGCVVNGRYWVLLASLTDVEYTLAVTDTSSPAGVSYKNLAGERTVVIDNNSLGACPPSTIFNAGTPSLAGTGLGSLSVRLPSPERGFDKGVVVPCTPDATTLCLVGDRFSVQARWASVAGFGDGQAFPVTSHSGAFWFFTAQSLEVLVKIVETCQAFELHLAGLSNAEYTLELTDTRGVGLWSYTHLLNTPPSATVVVFPRSCLFGDGFESGGVGQWSMAIGTLP